MAGVRVRIRLKVGLCFKLVVMLRVRLRSCEARIGGLVKGMRKVRLVSSVKVMRMVMDKYRAMVWGFVLRFELRNMVKSLVL